MMSSFAPLWLHTLPLSLFKMCLCLCAILRITEDRGSLLCLLWVCVFKDSLLCECLCVCVCVKPKHKSAHGILMHWDFLLGLQAPSPLPQRPPVKENNTFSCIFLSVHPLTMLQHECLSALFIHCLSLHALRKTVRAYNLRKKPQQSGDMSVSNQWEGKIPF